MITQLQDKIKGVIFGTAIGDALGLGTEFMSKSTVALKYPEGLTDYAQIIQDGHRRRWKPGEWTDDTNQMLCILNSILHQKKVDVQGIAQEIWSWAHTDGRGIGRTVYNAIASSAFKQTPWEVARKNWEASRKNAAANGGIMRTPILGIWEYQSPEKIKTNAENTCKITHYDPRCVGSCVMVCLVISALLREQHSDDLLLQQILNEGDQYDERIRPFLEEHLNADITALKLDDSASIGYTLKALGCGLWALKYPTSYEEGISAIIHEGGDADTNGAVAGAVLGARFGYDALPTRWKNGLLKKDWLLNKANLLIDLMIDQSQSASF